MMEKRKRSLVLRTVRGLSSYIAAWCLLFGMVITAFAADTSRSYLFELSVNGKQEIHAEKGDVLTVTLNLNRTDADEEADMYAMQDEIRYDDEFIEIVDGSLMMTEGIENTDIGLTDGDRAYYLNYLSMKGGEPWESHKLIANFQVKVLSDKGATTLKNENCVVSVKDGSDTYKYDVQDVKIIVTEEEAAAPEETETPEERAAEEESGGENTAAGMSNTMKLVLIGLGVYALCMLLFYLFYRSRYKKVMFDTGGGSAVAPVRVMKGKRIAKPKNPVKEGAVFAGWYKDYEFERNWDFKHDSVWENMTLYAKWVRL